MFGFGKPKVYDEDFDYDAVVSRYEGEMVVETTSLSHSIVLR